MPRKQKDSSLATRRRQDKPKPPPFVPTSAYAGTKKEVDTPPVTVLQFPQTSEERAILPALPPTSVQQETHMIITLKSISKNGKRAIFTAGAATFHVPVSAFPNGQPPATIPVEGEPFLPARTAKAKLTKEERAALPKPTLAQRAANAQKRAANAQKRADDLAAKLAAASQPQL